MSKIITRFLLIRDGDEVKRQIEEQYGSVNKFCEERGVVRRTLNKALAGEGFCPAAEALATTLVAASRAIVSKFELLIIIITSLLR